MTGRRESRASGLSVLGHPKNAGREFIEEGTIVSHGG